MIAIDKPMVFEEKRLSLLHSLELLDGLPEDEFDTITRLVAKFINVPISLFSLVDKERQWFKSKVGVELCETPRDISFCTHAIQQANLYVVEDADLDPLFSNNPLVTAVQDPIKFYAGVPVSIDGYPIGTLCVMDHKARVLTEEEGHLLTSLAKQIEKLIELRLLHLRSKEQEKLLRQQHERLKGFAGVISHDMKMPLANLIITSDIIKQKYSAKLDKEGVIYLNYLKSSSLTLSDYITNILRYYESDDATEESKSTFDIYELLEEVFEILHLEEQSTITLPEENLLIHTNKVVLAQVFLNLLTNAIKYNDKEITEVGISVTETENFYNFSVADNGPGIAKKEIGLIFNLYETLGSIDNKGNKGHGIGLSTVKKTCQALGGDIEVTSVLGKGTTFSFWIAK